MPSTCAAAPDRPNVLVILSDDQGWGDLSCNGNKNLATPHVDSLARESASFDRFYVCPVCSPTRAEFLTGRYHPRSGVRGVTMGDVFKAAGYATANFGKWHNGTQYPYHPNGRGFDEFYGFTSGHWGDYFSPPLDHNGRIVQGTGYTTDDFTEKTIKFIDSVVRGSPDPAAVVRGSPDPAQNGTVGRPGTTAQPFFAYVTYNTPHSPMQVPDRWWKRFANKDLTLRGTQPERENLDHTRAALAMCENIDWNVGRILKRLDELDIARDTIVVYFCDNGPNGDRWNGGFKGIKGSTDEGGIRSPLLIRWPGKIAAGRRIPQIAAAIDLLPTLAELAGVPLVSEKPLDGLSLKPLLVDGAIADGEANVVPGELTSRVIFSHWNGRVSAATGRFRLDHTGKLYDVVKDPGQSTNIASQQPQIKSRLTAAVKAWKRDVFADYDHSEQPFPVGHPNFRLTQLPARDGRPHGNIQRSSRHPNCSYFTNWTSIDDRITWDAEVDAPGAYEVELYYTCPVSDVGSTIELSFNGSRLQGQLTQPNDPPLRGAEYDRVTRQESYVKDFRPMKLGTINLNKGRGELTLRALNIPGSRVLDLRVVILARPKD